MSVRRIIMTTMTIPIQTASEPAAGAAVCPLCHTPELRMTDAALRAGGSWRCSVCDQMWSAQRLATVAAYVAFAARHDATSRAARASTV
jgi:transposase-like protein